MNPQETLSQLTLSNNPTNRLKAMIGGKNFASDKNDQCGAVSFRFTAKSSNKSNFVKVTLTFMDVYTVEFGSIRSLKYKTISNFENIYCDDLKQLFERETGLYLSF